MRLSEGRILICQPHSALNDIYTREALKARWLEVIRAYSYGDAWKVLVPPHSVLRVLTGLIHGGEEYGVSVARFAAGEGEIPQKNIAIAYISRVDDLPVRLGESNLSGVVLLKLPEENALLNLFLRGVSWVNM